MKTYRLFFLLPFISLVFLSCRSARKVVATDQSELNVSSGLALDSFQSDSSRYESYEVDKLVQRNFELEIIEWSSPDSLGKQYKVKTIKAVDKSVEQDATTSITDGSVVSNHVTFSESYKKSLESSKTKESKTTIDHAPYVIGGIVVLVVIVCFILYKYRIGSFFRHFS